MADPPRGTDSPETRTPDPTAAHRSSQRRLLFAIELTLFGLVLVVASPGSSQVGVILAGIGLFIGLTGL